MVKTRDIQVLSESEQILLQRFEKIQTIEPSDAIKDIVEDYQDGVFFKDIFQIIAEDVFKILSITEWNKINYRKILNCANFLCKQGTGFWPTDRRIVYALPTIWISYCTNYRKKGYVFSLPSELRGLDRNKRCIQWCMSSQFFNSFGGYPPLKEREFEQYMFWIYGEECRKNTETIKYTVKNFQTLITLLSYTGFSYEGPCKDIRV